MTHLTPDELIDAIEGALPADRRPHLASCPECARQRDDLAAVLNEAKQTSVPEPSPFYWTQLSTRVRAAVDAEAERSSWPQWMRWQTLLPLGIVAMIILALMASVPKPDPVAPVEPVALVAPVGEADQWGAVAELVGDFDLDAAAETGVIEPGLAEQAALELNAEEQAELMRLLQAELRAKS